MRKQFICLNLDESITDCFNTGDIIEGGLLGGVIHEIIPIRIQSESRHDFVVSHITGGHSQYSLPQSGHNWKWGQLP